MKATFDPAKNMNLYFRNARNGSKEFRFLDDTGAAYDLTGQSFAFRSDFTMAVTILSNVLTLTILASEVAKRSSYFWELYNVTSGKTWLCGNAYFTDSLSAQGTDSQDVTINLQGEIVEVVVGASGGVDHFRGDWDPAGNILPNTGGNGTLGVALAGDEWVLTDTLTLVDGPDTFVYSAGTIVKAQITDPGQVKANWLFFGMQL